MQVLSRQKYTSGHNFSFTKNVPFLFCGSEISFQTPILQTNFIPRSGEDGGLSPHFYHPHWHAPSTYIPVLLRVPC